MADIGNGTMNVLYMVDGKPLSGKTFTEKFGTYQCTPGMTSRRCRPTWAVQLPNSPWMCTAM